MPAAVRKGEKYVYAHTPILSNSSVSDLSGATSSFLPSHARPITDLSSANHAPMGFSCPIKGDFQRRSVHAFRARSSAVSAQAANKQESANPAKYVFIS